MNLKKITLLLLLVGSIASCVKKAEETEDVTATAEEVGLAIAEAWGDTDPLSMSKRDFVYYVTEQTVENNPRVYFTLEEGITIADKEDKGDHYLYTYLYQHRTRIGDRDRSPEATREDTRKVGKASADLNAMRTPALEKDLKTMSGDDYHMTLGFERVLGLLYSCVETEEWLNYCKEKMQVDTCKLQCANLKVEELMTPVPNEVKLQENCGGYANCMWRNTLVKFDWILTLKKGNESATQRLNYVLTLSPDLPFLARMTSFCERGMKTVPSGERFLVSTCTKLNNYRPAAALPTP